VTSEATIQFKKPFHGGLYFDDDEQAVTVTEPVYPADEPNGEETVADIQKLKQEILVALMASLIARQPKQKPPTLAEVGRRVLVLNHLVSRGRKPQAALALRLGLSTSQTCARLQKARAEIGLLAARAKQNLAGTPIKARGFDEGQNFHLPIV
jgi:hypothetical protein